MRVEPQGGEAYLGGGGAEKDCYLADIHGVWSGVVVVGVYGALRGCAMTMEEEVVEEALSAFLWEHIASLLSS